MMRYRVAAVLCWLLGACAHERDAPRIVVLVVIDSLRADHVGAYGYDRLITPNLDALAEKGVVFERSYAGSSFRTQSLSTLWTGRLPSSGGSSGLYGSGPHPLLLTLPRLFLRAGFRTGLVSNIRDLGDRGFTRGFDDLEIDSVPGRWSGELVTSKALEIMDGAAGAPIFLTVAYGDASEPHLPPQEYRDRIDIAPPVRPLTLPDLRASAGSLPEDVQESPGFLDLVARYDAEIAYVDACLGNLVDGLTARGVLDDTLIIVTSTHGEEFLEHGYVGSGWTLYEEVVRVPLVVYAPGVKQLRIEEPVSLADVVPTLRQVYALPVDRHRPDGQVLFDLDAGRMSPRPRGAAVIAEVVMPELCISRACVEGNSKLIESISWPAPRERLGLLAGYDAALRSIQDGEVPQPNLWGSPIRRELYDLPGDPSEGHDVSASSAERLGSLSEALERYAESCRRNGLAARSAGRPAELSTTEDLEQLQELGYL